MEPIYTYVDALPTDGVTVRLLRALDFVAPGQWQNLTGFDATIQAVTGETDPQIIWQIRNRATELFNDTSQGYQRALWLYQMVDRTDKPLGTAAMANAVGQKVGFLSFLSRMTPKADKLQSIDLSVKLVVELVAFCYTNGIPGDSIGDFVAALNSYERENLIRMAALVCFDGLIPLGDQFVDKVNSLLSQSTPNDLAQNQTFQRVAQLIPGGDVNGQFGFIQSSLGSVRDWMTGFVGGRGLTQSHVFQNIQNWVDASANNMDLFAAYLDMSTNYFEHTGTQSMARSLIERSVSEI
jgi:hypothetical protein